MSRRKSVIGLLLVATLVAAYFAPEPESGLVAPAKRQDVVSPRTVPAQSRVPSSEGALEVLSIKPRASTGEEPGVLGAMQWVAPPPPPPPKVEPPPPPQAPPLPFKVLGQYEENGAAGVFLLHRDQSLVVREGDTLLDVYKVESLKDGVLTFLYLPLNQRQTLTVGIQ